MLCRTAAGIFIPDGIIHLLWKLKKRWLKWKERHSDRDDWLAPEQPESDARSDAELDALYHYGTINCCAVDTNGDLSGVTTTSGLSFKIPGRVGDSPIIGAGLYVDNEVGGATATGWGEAVIRAVGCFLVVELMRQGHGPAAACELAVERVIEKNPDWRDIQVGFLALSKSGEVGSFCIAPGFNYAVYTPDEGNRLIDAPSRL